LKASNASPKMKTMEEKKVGVRSLICNILGVRGVCRSFEMEIKTNDKWVNYLYGHIQTKQQVG
jgi:hypothetical protein